MTIGERIRHLRAQQGKSLTEFAEEIGISKQQLYKYEKGFIKNIPYEKIESIADCLNVSPALVMGWVERYYIIGNDGNVWGESESKKYLELQMDNFSKEDIEKYELEIVAEPFDYDFNGENT